MVVFKGLYHPFQPRKEPYTQRRNIFRFTLTISFKEKPPFCPQKPLYRPILHAKSSSIQLHIGDFSWPGPEGEGRGAGGFLWWPGPQQQQGDEEMLTFVPARPDARSASSGNLNRREA